MRLHRAFGALVISVAAHWVLGLLLPERVSLAPPGRTTARIEVEVNQAATPPIAEPPAARVEPPLVATHRRRTPLAPPGRAVATEPAAPAPAAPAPPPAASAAAPATAPASRFSSFFRAAAPAIPAPPMPAPDELALLPRPRVDPMGTWRTPSGVEGRIMGDGSIRFRDPSGFEFADAVGGGRDPYAAQKRRFADQTREERLKLAVRDEGDRRRSALLAMRGQLEALSRSIPSVADRRRAIFEFWDDCIEDRVGAEAPLAAAARATVLAFARRTFPRGSAIEYSAAEIAAFNGRRTSREPFEPYNGAAPPRGETVAAEGHEPTGR